MQTKTPKIAFIGMEGSGKTVLISVLAKKMSEIISQGYYLDPQNNRTFQYVENVWMTLQNGEWPPSTPPGERFKLDWKLKQGENECDVRMIDAAGQDFRLLFTGEEVDIDENEMPAQLVSLANYCREADILLFTINIKDFVGESDSTRMTENQGAIKQALDFLKKGNKRIALLFTQYDQYSSMIEKSGGLQEFCKQKLRYIYNAYINEGKTEIIGVAAVNETEMREMEDGTLQRVPVQNFSSEGLIEVINWIVDKVIEVSKEKTVEFISEQYVKNENEEQINPTYHAGAENQVGNESTDRIATPSENAFGTPLWVKSVQPLGLFS